MCCSSKHPNNERPAPNSLVTPPAAAAEPNIGTGTLRPTSPGPVHGIRGWPKTGFGVAALLPCFALCTGPYLRSHTQRWYATSHPCCPGFKAQLYPSGQGRYGFGILAFSFAPFFGRGPFLAPHASGRKPRKVMLTHIGSCLALLFLSCLAGSRLGP